MRALALDYGKTVSTNNPPRFRKHKPGWLNRLRSASTFTRSYNLNIGQREIHEQLRYWKLQIVGRSIFSTLEEGVSLLSVVAFDVDNGRWFASKSPLEEIIPRSSRAFHPETRIPVKFEFLWNHFKTLQRPGNLERDFSDFFSVLGRRLRLMRNS